MNIFEIKYIISVVILSIFDQTNFVCSSAVDDNNIIKAESIIRATANTLFYTLGLRKIRKNPKLQQYALVHNYFIAITLRDYKNMRDIVKLTKTNKTVQENDKTNLIDLLNEILNENHVHKMQNIIMGEEYRSGYDADAEIEKMKHLKVFHAQQRRRNMKINENVLQIIKEEEKSLEFEVNTTGMNGSDNNVLDEIPKWRREVKPLSIQRRIYNGKRTKIKEYPFMASVEIFGVFQCGGSIIKSDLVITAASCLQLAWNNRFYRENPAFLTVRVGSSFYEVGGEQVEVIEIYFYPSYDPKTLHHNIAIMRLVRKLNFKNKSVKKIQIGQTKHLKEGRVEVVGWGAYTASNNLHGPLEDKLKTATLDIYDLDDCQEIYSKKYITNRNFCAGFISIGSGACNRDAGGPGIMSDQLAGIISFGSNFCGKPDTPTVFTKLYYYEDWITDIMEQIVPTIKHVTTNKPPKPRYPRKPPKHVKAWSLVPISTLRPGEVDDDDGLRSPNSTEIAQSSVSSLPNVIDNISQTTNSLIEFLNTMFLNETHNEPRPMIRKKDKKRTTAGKLTILEEQQYKSEEQLYLPDEPIHTTEAPQYIPDELQNTPEYFDTPKAFTGTMLYDFNDVDSYERKTDNPKDLTVTLFEEKESNEIDTTEEETEISSQNPLTEITIKPSSVLQKTEWPNKSIKDIMRNQKLSTKPYEGDYPLYQDSAEPPYIELIKKYQEMDTEIISKLLENENMLSTPPAEHKSSQSAEEDKNSLESQVTVLDKIQNENLSKEDKSADSRESADRLTTKHTRFEKVTKFHRELLQMVFVTSVKLSKNQTLDKKTSTFSPNENFQQIGKLSTVGEKALPLLMDSKSKTKSAKHVSKKQNNAQPKTKSELDMDYETFKDLIFYGRAKSANDTHFKPNLKLPKARPGPKKDYDIFSELLTLSLSSVYPIKADGQTKLQNQTSANFTKISARSRDLASIPDEDILEQAQHLQKLQTTAEMLLQHLKNVQKMIMLQIPKRRALIKQKSSSGVVQTQAHRDSSRLLQFKNDGKNNSSMGGGNQN